CFASAGLTGGRFTRDAAFARAGIAAWAVIQGGTSMYVDFALLVLRVAVGVVIIGHGILKWGWLGGGGSLTGVAGWFNGLGFRPGMVWALVASLAEAVGGALTVLGLGGPIGLSVGAAVLVVGTVVAHRPKGFWAEVAERAAERPRPHAEHALERVVAGGVVDREQVELMLRDRRVRHDEAHHDGRGLHEDDRQVQRRAPLARAAHRLGEEVVVRD